MNIFSHCDCKLRNWLKVTNLRLVRAFFTVNKWATVGNLGQRHSELSYALLLNCGQLVKEVISVIVGNLWFSNVVADRPSITRGNLRH